MAAAHRGAEGGYIFSKSSDGVFSKFIRPGGSTPYPFLFLTPVYTKNLPFNSGEHSKITLMTNENVFLEIFLFDIGYRIFDIW